MKTQEKERIDTERGEFQGWGTRRWKLFFSSLSLPLPLQFSLSPTIYKGSNFPIPLPTRIVVFIIAILEGVK